MSKPYSCQPQPTEASLPFQTESRIKTLMGEHDTDKEGQARFTPPGSIGVLVYENIPGQWSVHFGDAAIYIAECDLRDPAQYELQEPIQNDLDNSQVPGPQG